MFFDFIEIGTSDFDTLIQLVDNGSSTYGSSIYGSETRGLSIEPIKHYLDKLPNPKNCYKENVAISNKSGTVDIYYVPEETIKKHNLPQWVTGCSCVNNYHPSVVNYFNENNLDYKDYIIKDTVEVCDLHTILHKYNVSGIYLLKVDTEGHDPIILNHFLDNIGTNRHLLPHKIVFETNCLSTHEDINNMIDRLKTFGYEVVTQIYGDTHMELNVSSIQNKSYFSEPIPKYWLGWHPDNYDPNNLPHPNTLEGAKQYCIEHNCGGVTYQNGKYEVRKGIRLYTCKDADPNIISWTYI